MNFLKSKHQFIELAIHMLFWSFIFSSVNINWKQNWFDPSLRPSTPFPLAVILFPFLFYANAYWALPKFLMDKKWISYALKVAFIFIGPELIRLFFYEIVLQKSFQSEISSRDSFIMGSPNVAWMAFVFSFLYRLTREQFFNKQSTSGTITKSPSSQAALQDSEAEKLSADLFHLMDERKLFLDKDLDLGSLSLMLNITDKKLSTLINQNFGLGFTDYVNAYRIQAFLEKVDSGQLDQLSIAGLADQCGFSSKTTFYRAFKKIYGCTPTHYLSSGKPSPL